MSTLPGLTINLENSSHTIQDQIEDEISRDQQEQGEKIRQLLEAELNDDDLIDDESSNSSSQLTDSNDDDDDHEDEEKRSTSDDLDPETRRHFQEIQRQVNKLSWTPNFSDNNNNSNDNDQSNSDSNLNRNRPLSAIKEETNSIRSNPDSSIHSQQNKNFVYSQQNFEELQKRLNFYKNRSDELESILETSNISIRNLSENFERMQLQNLELKSEILLMKKMHQDNNNNSNFSRKTPKPKKPASTQTNLTMKSFTQLKECYSKYLKKMKEDLVRHCQEQQERNTKSFHEQILKERQRVNLIVPQN